MKKAFAAAAAAAVGSRRRRRRLPRPSRQWRKPLLFAFGANNKHQLAAGAAQQPGTLAALLLLLLQQRRLRRRQQQQQQQIGRELEISSFCLPRRFITLSPFGQGRLMLTSGDSGGGARAKQQANCEQTKEKEQQELAKENARMQTRETQAR